MLWFINILSKIIFIILSILRLWIEKKNISNKWVSAYQDRSTSSTASSVHCCPYERCLTAPPAPPNCLPERGIRSAKQALRWGTIPFRPFRRISDSIGGLPPFPAAHVQTLSFDNRLLSKNVFQIKNKYYKNFNLKN